MSNAFWSAFPLIGATTSVVSNVYLTPFSVILYLSPAKIARAGSGAIVTLSISASRSGTGSVG